MANILQIPSYSYKFSLFILRVYFLIKGIAGSLLVYGSLPLFQSFGVDSNTYQKYVCLGLVPWALKPLVGVTSDTFSIYGWKKRYYVLFAAVLGSVSSFVLFVAQTEVLSVVMMFFFSTAIMIIDLLMESLYSMQITYASASQDIVSYVWGYIMLGTSVGAIFVGPLADHGHVSVVYLLGVVLFAQLVYPLIKQPHDVLPSDYEFNSVDQERLVEEIASKQPIPPGVHEWLLSGALFVGSFLMILCMFAASNHPWITVYFGGIVLCILFVWVVIRYYDVPPYWACCVYMSFVEILYIDISGAQDYFFTAKEACNPGGPKFTYTFYITLGVCMGGICGCIGSFAYKNGCSNWNMRTCILFGLCARSLCAIVDISIAKRWNKEVGISDSVAFLLGDAALGPMISMMLFIPMFIMMSQLVQPGKETFTFAILAGFQNLGQVFSKMIGVSMSQGFGVVAKANTPTCNFEFYPALILFAHMMFPLLCVPLGYLLIPERVKEQHVRTT